MSEAAMLTVEQKIEILTGVSQIDPNRDPDEITTAATAFVAPYAGTSNRYLHILRQLIRETLDLKWGSVLRAKGPQLIDLARQGVEKLGGDPGAPVEAPAPKKEPVKKTPVKKDPPAEKPKKDPAPEAKSDAEEAPAEPKKRRSVRKKKPKEAETPAPAPEEKPAKTAVKSKPKLEEPQHDHGNPGFELGAWDRYLGEMETMRQTMAEIRSSQKTLEARFDQIIDLIKESHNDLGAAMEQQVGQLRGKVETLYEEQLKMLEDEDYIPPRKI